MLRPYELAALTFILGLAGGIVLAFVCVLILGKWRGEEEKERENYDQE